MELHIGKTIKRLRRQRDMTQENLAEYLNVSAQAVSKWETGLAYPDIALIPTISKFFGVTTDELFGCDRQEDERRIEEVLVRYDELNRQGLLDENRDHLRTALQEFPGDHRLLMKYASVMFNTWAARGDSNALDEAMSKAELVLQDADDDELRYQALQIVAYCYRDTGQMDKAVRMVHRFPSYVNRERIMASILDGDAKIEALQTNIYIDLAQAINNVDQLARMAWRTGQREDSLRLRRFGIKLHSLSSQGCPSFMAATMARFHLEYAENMIEMGQHDESLLSLETAASLARLADSDELPDETSLSLSGLLFGRIDTSTWKSGKNYPESEVELMLRLMGSNRFDPIRETPAFRDIESELRAITGSQY